jgi:nucleotide-binding universal stress UspA family protein
MVTSGLAYSRILQTAERLDIDLIVLGAIGSSASAGLGEVASHVVKFANCSVLIVR